ncbi:hypothetical protein NOCARDAX2BIS_430024 [Nocardioides sp. AX2bis]|nr:hypothetical protein NOCARDAX2BIS_430024 [Nocardioides sp. AX2bis]
MLTIEELVSEYEGLWATASMADLDLSSIPRVVDDYQWSLLRSAFAGYIWGSTQDGIPALLAHSEDTFRLNGYLQKLQVLLIVYADGVAETHYLRNLSTGSETAMESRQPARVAGGNHSPDASLLIVTEPSFGIDHMIEPDPGSRAQDVVRVLACLSKPGARRALAGFQGGTNAVPEPRLVRDAFEAEELAAEWVRAMGYPDAVTTARGADGGIDIHTPSSRKVAGQVKFEAVKTGRQVLQQLYGAGQATGATTFVFFSSAGYTRAASEWANAVGIALFRFQIDGSVRPENGLAELLLRS